MDKYKTYYVVEYKYIYVADMFCTEVDNYDSKFVSKKEAIAYAKQLKELNTAENFPNFDIRIYRKKEIPWEFLP